MKRRDGTNYYGSSMYRDEKYADKLFQRAANHCHELGRSADVQSVITTVMRNPEWAHSQPLVQVVAGLVHRETVTANTSNAAEVWSRWYVKMINTSYIEIH